VACSCRRIAIEEVSWSGSVSCPFGWVQCMYTSLPLNPNLELISFGYKTFLLNLTIMMQIHLEKIE